MNEQDRHNLFSELISRHQSELYAYILAIVRNWEDADDLYQTVCLVLWSKFELFRPGSSFFSWARQTAKITVRNFLRHKYLRRHVSEELLNALSETVIETRNDGAGVYLTALRNCKEKLSATDEALLELRYVEDLGSRQIADRIRRSQQSICRSLAHSTLATRMCPDGNCAAGALGEGTVMTEPAVNADYLLYLVESVCDEDASENDLVELDSILLTDDMSRRCYLDYYQLRVALRLELRAEQATQKVHQQINIKPAISSPSDSSSARTETPPATPFGFLSTTFPATIGYSSGWPVAYLTATVITGLWILSLWLMPVSEQAATHSLPPVVEQQLAPEPRLVGRITGVVDCNWTGGSRVSLGQKVDLASGLMEITYDTGAKVILQGPVTYAVETNGGYLSLGKLTGKLEKRGERRGERGEGPKISDFRSQISDLSPSPLSSLPSPLFVIRTPTATVTDLGTEFSVEVSRDKITVMHVIRGAVEVRRDDRTGGAPVRERLVAGEAIRFASLSAPPERIVVRSSDATPSPPAAEVWRDLRDARRWQTWLHPVGLVATAYHRVWGADGKLLAESGRQQAFHLATDNTFGRGEGNAPACSSFDTMSTNQSQTAFVGLRYGRLTRFDQIKVFMGRQMGDGGNWSAMPRVFILKNNVDTNQTSPEDDPANWRELPLRQVYGAAFSASPSANPGCR